MLSFKTKHDTLDLMIILFTGTLPYFMELSATPYSVGATSRIHSLRTKCHTEQSATPHGGGHPLNLWGPPLESVGLLLLCTFVPRKLIILNKLQLVWVWEEVMDAGMISCL